MWPLLIAGLVASAVVALLVANGPGSPSALAATRPEVHPQNRWAACNRNAHNGRPSTFHPLSDKAAAALVTREPETRPYNAKPYTIFGKRYPSLNSYVPTRKQLRAFHSAKVSNGETVEKFNPYLKYVNGRDGMRDPSTDDLIQWAAHKWGIPENWLRAEYVQESYWNGFMLGDEAEVPSSWYRRYPVQARVRDSDDVYESMGITQVKWIANGSVGSGTEPLRWESTAFNLDYQAATVRFYYDNPSGARSSWGDATYRPCQQWSSIGAWYEPYPWGNGGQHEYVSKVQALLRSRVWTSSSFVSFRPSSFPRGVRFEK